MAWELPQVGGANSWGGVLGLASCVLFFGADGGMFSAVDGKTGKPLWNFHTNAQFKASRMTYEFDQKQYVAITAGQSILAFALPE